MLVVPRLWDSAGCLEDELRVLLVDRQPLFMAALAELVRGGCPRASIETSTDSEQAVHQVLQHPVDLLFCEARAEPLGGAELASRLVAAAVRTKVVLLGDPEDRELLLMSLACGAVGFFTKAASPEELIDGTHAILDGHRAIGASLADMMPTLCAERTPVADSAARLGQLSDAERSILIMLGRAQSTRAIAASRGISPKTVRNHLGSIYRKLAVRNRTEAVVWSARAGLTEMAEES